MITKLVLQMISLAAGGTFKEISKSSFSTLQIPLPPLTVQQEIVDEIESYQRIIDGARQVVDNYKSTIKVEAGWESVSLSDEKLFRIEAGGTPDTGNPDYWNGGICWATLSGLPASDFVTALYDTEHHISLSGLKNSAAKILPINTVLASWRATIGRIAIAKCKTATNQGFKNIIVLDKEKVLQQYALDFTIQSSTDNIQRLKVYFRVIKNWFDKFISPSIWGYLTIKVDFIVHDVRIDMELPQNRRDNFEALNRLSPKSCVKIKRGVK